MTVTTSSDLSAIISELKRALGDEYVMTEYHQRAIRTASASPMGLHLWQDLLPDVVVMPASTEEVVAIVKAANKYGVPIVPRGSGAGLADGAQPMKRGIVVDIKRMCEILEIDDDDMTVTVQPGINMQELNKVLRPLNLWFPDDPASYPVNVLGGRIGCSGWSLIGSGYGHLPNLVCSMEVVTPTGEVIRVGEGGGRKIRKSSVGYRIKDLFIGHQGTLGITTEVTLDLSPRPEAEFPIFFGTRSWEEAHQILYGINHSGIRSVSGMFIFDEWKVNFLRRDDEAWIPLPEWVKSAVGIALYGTNEEVEGVKQRIVDIGEAAGGVYMGREISEGDWASRHDRYHLAYHGRSKDKDKIKLMSWSCEDASITWSQLSDVRLEWHKIIADLTDKHPELFDDWGMFADIGNPFRAWGDYLTEIDVGVNEQEMTPEAWADWIEAKKAIARVSLAHGGSISMAHGGTREGEVDVACYEELAEGQFEIMKRIKRMLDPNNIMNPGKYNLDDAYTEEAQA